MQETWQKYKWLPMTVFGSAVFAAGFAFFLQPNDLSPGGISGLALILVELTGAYSDKSPLVKAVAMDADDQMVVYSTDGRAAIFSTAQLLPKTTRNTQGVAVLSLKKKAVLSDAVLLTESGITNESRYRTKTIPSAGAILKEEDSVEKQQTFDV